MHDLAPWALNPEHTRGRRVAEASAAPRSEHQRDRDRIVHSTAFRRLVYKTQVFANHEGDLFRTRLTHSLEVAQLGRSMARHLHLNEDLVEAIALAHDLGHTPFGHAGQDALAQCMASFGGFEHNLQSLRVVDSLEVRYADFDGLNLCFETREGILKHCSKANAAALELAEPGGVASRFLRGLSPSLEAQLVNLADEIAYNTHDIDDGLRSGLLTIDQLEELTLFTAAHASALTQHPQLVSGQMRRQLGETLRRMLASQVNDLLAATDAALRQHAPASSMDVRNMPALVCFSESMRKQTQLLKQFLFKSLYRHPQVEHTTEIARQVVAELFDAYLRSPGEMPEDYAGAVDLPRAVADYVAGMTDRFAVREHQRLTQRNVFGLVA